MGKKVNAQWKQQIVPKKYHCGHRVNFFIQFFFEFQLLQAVNWCSFFYSQSFELYILFVSYVFNSKVGFNMSKLHWIVLSLEMSSIWFDTYMYVFPDYMCKCQFAHKLISNWVYSIWNLFWNHISSGNVEFRMSM